LIEAGFKPVDQPDRRFWEGPIADALRALTPATSMQIEFVDGWPYHQPRLLVDGISTEHTNNRGEICLWQTGAASRPWLTFKGLTDRIAEWVEAADAGFPDDGILDAHLYYDPKHHTAIATIDIGRIDDRRREEHGRIYGRWRNNGHLLELATNDKAGGDIAGRWYFAPGAPAPPRDIDDVRNMLNNTQARSLNLGLAAVESGKGERLVLVLWETRDGTNALTLTQRLAKGNVEVSAIETAPTDHKYLEGRAGPDFDALQQKRVLIYGAGAVGSHIAVHLAECGTGTLVLRDSEILRPGNVVRHAASRAHIGWTKTRATEAVIQARVPWTKVEIGLATWNPSEIATAVADADVVVDATGNAGFADMLSDICQQQSRPLVSAALYRRGAVGRICRQAAEADTPIRARDVGIDPRYPLIPPGDEPVIREPGCSAVVNSAPPSAVAALAAQTTVIIIDTITGTFSYDDELIEVYRPLDVAPFDHVGTLRVER
jgi:molybdopterin/thiamine biosynthesis adenylyltransferase